MSNLLIVIAVVATALTAGISCQRPHIIYPTYRPPPNRPVIIRTARQVDNEPLWLYKDDNIDRAPATGDHPYLPPYIDDIKMDPHRRTARSFNSRRSSAGESWLPSLLPTAPSIDRRLPMPIYARVPRDINIPGFKKPTYHDVIIPNWNPNVKTDPRDVLGMKRNTRRF